MGPVIKTLQECGIETEELSDKYIFRLVSKDSFVIDAHNSFAASTNALIASLFKNGKSRIINCTKAPEFADNLIFLKQSGVQCRLNATETEIEGPVVLSPTEFRCMSDKNDFVTWLFAAIAAKSTIEFTNVNLKKINITPLFPILDTWGISLNQIDEQIVRIDLSKMHLKPVEVIAGNYPLFHSDWQPLIAPILTQIEGTSIIVDTLFDNRLRYWEQLGKMGARFEFYKDPRAEEKNGNPRAVRVFGATKLQATKLEATDVRAGAGFAIAGLIAQGKTKISGMEHIERGYEDLETKLKKLTSS